MYHKSFTITGKTSSVLKKISHFEGTLKKVKIEKSTSLKMHKDQNKNSNKQNKGDLFFYFVILKLYANKQPIYIVLIIKL